MLTVNNPETKKVEWHLNKWYEKVAFVFGVIYTGILVISFVIGFFTGLLDL